MLFRSVVARLLGGDREFGAVDQPAQRAGRQGEVRVGDVTVRNVPAVVIPGQALGTTLLGMSFLARLQRFEIARGELLLTE